MTMTTELFAGATDISQSYAFSRQSTTSRLLSMGIHVAAVGLALIPWTIPQPQRPKLNETAVVLYRPTNLVLPPLPGSARPQGGGGGGKRQPRPASLGVLPRPADRQFVPPDPEPPKNLDPLLISEPTIVAPELAMLRPLTLMSIGDPNGIVGPPSSGIGDGGGIGNGDGRGVGDRKGPGKGDGDDGGFGDRGPYRVGGGISAPTVLFRVEPEYSEEARKARFQGIVVLEAVVRRDGKIDVVHLVRSLGFGLDQNAIDALKKWRFRPATKGGTPVDSIVSVEVRFNLR